MPSLCIHPHALALLPVLTASSFASLLGLQRFALLLRGGFIPSPVLGLVPLFTVDFRANLLGFFSGVFCKHALCGFLLFEPKLLHFAQYLLKTPHAFVWSRPKFVAPKVCWRMQL